MAGEVAAVDRRHVCRFEPVQVARVVPVVQVAAEELELADRRHGFFEALEHVEGADPTEVASGHRGEQVHPDVGGRRAMFDDRTWIVLEVVGRQPVVFRGDERFEEEPRATGDEAECFDVVVRELTGR